MTTTMKRFTIILVVFFAAIFFAQYMISSSINGINSQESIMITEKPDKTQKDAKAKRAMAEMTPEERYQEAKKNLDLDEIKRKYGISATPRRHGPESPEEWQDYMEKNIVTPQFLNKPETQRILSRIQTSEVDYAKQMNHVEEAITAVKAEIANDPLNKDNKMKLQHLYRLKALTKAIKKNIVTKESASVPELTPSSTNL